MKIATYNINGINGRLEILLRWLKEANPDIVCLQELKSENHKFPEKKSKRQVIMLSGRDRKAGMVLPYWPKRRSKN